MIYLVTHLCGYTLQTKFQEELVVRLQIQLIHLESSWIIQYYDTRKSPLIFDLYLLFLSDLRECKINPNLCQNWSFKLSVWNKLLLSRRLTREYTPVILWLLSMIMYAQIYSFFQPKHELRWCMLKHCHGIQMNDWKLIPYSLGAFSSLAAFSLFRWTWSWGLITGVFKVWHAAIVFTCSSSSPCMSNTDSFSGTQLRKDEIWSPHIILMSGTKHIHKNVYSSQL
jgi:hypothetical protein